MICIFFLNYQSKSNKTVEISSLSDYWDLFYHATWSAKQIRNNGLCDYASLGSSPACPQFSSLKLCPTFSNPGRLKHHLNKTKTARETFLHYPIKVSPLHAHAYLWISGVLQPIRQKFVTGKNIRHAIKNCLMVDFVGWGVWGGWYGGWVGYCGVFSLPLHKKAGTAFAFNIGSPRWLGKWRVIEKWYSYSGEDGYFSHQQSIISKLSLIGT